MSARSRMLSRGWTTQGELAASIGDWWSFVAGEHRHLRRSFVFQSIASQEWLDQSSRMKFVFFDLCQKPKYFHCRGWCHLRKFPKMGNFTSSMAAFKTFSLLKNSLDFVILLTFKYLLYEILEQGAISQKLSTSWGYYFISPRWLLAIYNDLLS